MSGLIFLTKDDFHLEQGTNNTLLCHKINGFSLILFYSIQCDYCKKLLPNFRRLPGMIGVCQFGLVNIAKNKSLINLSNKTVSPIEYVPFLILYANGKPFMR